MRRATVPDGLRDRPFTLDMASAAGITPSCLQAAPWKSVLRTVWVHQEVPDSRELRLAAARLVIPDYGVLCGLTAAWVLGVDVRREGDLDVHVGFDKGRRIRKRDGLEVCQESLDESDWCLIDGVRVTTPLRTAFDCLRWLRRAEPVVVADALTHAGLVPLDELRAYFASKRRLRNLRIGEALLDLVDPQVGIADGDTHPARPHHRRPSAAGVSVGDLYAGGDLRRSCRLCLPRAQGRRG